MKRTYQPSKIKRVKKHGYMNRNKDKNGKKVLRRRRRKNRNIVTIKKYKK